MCFPFALIMRRISSISHIESRKNTKEIIGFGTQRVLEDRRYWFHFEEGNCYSICHFSFVLPSFSFLSSSSNYFSPTYDVKHFQFQSSNYLTFLVLCVSEWNELNRRENCYSLSSFTNFHLALSFFFLNLTVSFVSRKNARFLFFIWNCSLCSRWNAVN